MCIQSRNKREGAYAGKARNYHGVYNKLNFGKVKHFRTGKTSYESLKQIASFYKLINI